jgi:putative PIN family toxin of toxin-antitoxin system
MLRVVLDTNILVSALISEGTARQLVVELLDTHTVILSSQIIAELADVLTREKFIVKSSQVNRFVSGLVKTSKIVPDNPRFKVISEDADDDVILNVAYTGKADYLVTGDKHLLALKQFKKTRIVTVNQMHDILT